jgi:CubicO group peptidase (beta-lactamase class C family)
LPEDNPWGDRQMAISKEALRDFLKGGLSFSNPPGQEYEYSNLGFVLLGQVINKAARLPFQRYITEKLLRPLGMNQTSWEYSNYGPDKFAAGYRWEHDAWKPEPILHDGEGAACGGIITTLNNFARYVTMHLDAWPARDVAEVGPVRRSTLRELHKPLTFRSLNAKSVGFYGYGLGWSVDSRGIVALGHSGGLPGYGSYYRFLPDYGIGIIGFANRTYAKVDPAVVKAFDVLLERGGLQPREIAVSPILQARKEQVAKWIVSWDEKLGDQIAAENFFLDRSREDWMSIIKGVFAKSGKISSIGPMRPFNQLRGRFEMESENGTVNVFFTLTPEKDPKVQELNVSFAPKN